MENFEIATKAPASVTETELNDFVALVREGGEVADELENRIKFAHALITIRSNSCAIAAAAVKCPAPGYRFSIFRKSNRPDIAEVFR